MKIFSKILFTSFFLVYSFFYVNGISDNASDYPYHNFTNYSSQVGNSKSGTSIKFAGDANEFTYTSIGNNGGLVVAISQNDGSYQYYQYNSSSPTNGIPSYNGIDSSISDDGSVIAYCTSDNCFAYGIRAKQSNLYDFTSCSDETPGINSQYGLFGKSVAVNGVNKNIIYATDGGGLSIGTFDFKSSSYSFENYLSADGIGSDSGIFVSYSSKYNNVLYASQNSGIAVGFPNPTTHRYDFSQYNVANTNGGITSNNAVYATFADNGDIAYLGADSGFSIGKYNAADKTYTFHNYNTSNTNLSSNNCTSFSFSPTQQNGSFYVACSTSNKGIFVSNKPGDDSFNFVNFNSENKGITSNNINDISLSKNLDVGIALQNPVNSSYGGLSIGYLLNANWISNDIVFEERANRKYEINSLKISLSYPLQDLPVGYYFKVVIGDDSNPNIYALILTRTSYFPEKDKINYLQTSFQLFPEGDGLLIQADRIIGNNGFDKKKYNLNVSVGPTEAQQISIDSYIINVGENNNSKSSFNTTGLIIGLSVGIPFTSLIIIYAVGKRKGIWKKLAK